MPLFKKILFGVSLKSAKLYHSEIQVSVLSRVADAHFCGPTKNSTTGHLSNSQIVTWGDTASPWWHVCQTFHAGKLFATHSKVLVVRKKRNKQKESNKEEL